VSCSRPDTVHVSAVIVRSRSSKGRVCDALGVETKSGSLWVVLRHWKSTRNHFRLESVAEAVLILVRVTFASVLLALKIGVVKDMVDILGRLAFVDGLFEQLGS